MYAPQHPGPNMGHQQQASSSMCSQNGPHPSMNANGMAYGLPHTPLAPHDVNHASMAALSQAFSGMAVQEGAPLRTTDMALPGLTVTAPQLGLMPAHGNLHQQQQALLLMHNGVVYAPTHMPSYPCLPGQGSAPPGPAIHALPDRHYPRTAPFQRQMALGRDYNMMPVTPTPRVFGPPPEPAGEHPPGLDDRQVSIGSHSDGDQVPSPDTPDAIDANRLGQNVVIARADVSPLVQYGYGPTSPPHFVQTFDAAHMAKAMAMHPMPNDLLALTTMSPAIPRAVPAVSSCRKTLQHCFENPSGTTNVYIRGLHPNTTDDMLLAYAARFGHVANSKAMIDNQTGACKGFGFACFRSLEEAHNCIRGFYSLGYEVSFARESFNARLKSFADPSSTNLYVSNLPRSMTEAELEKVFLPDFKVQSSRIIRDAQNHSKGVGFARFGSREECDQIIKQFHGQPIGQEQLPLQVRYADTPEQKRLKHETQKRREFRANEYNSVAYGPSAMYSYRPIHNEILGAAIAGNRLRQMNMGWTGLPGPNFNAVGRPIQIMDPTANFKSERPTEGAGKAESQNAGGPHPNENAQVGITSPTIAHGDTYAPAVAVSVAASA